METTDTTGSELAKAIKLIALLNDYLPPEENV